MNLFRKFLLEDGVKDEHIIMVDLENRRNKKLRDPDSLLEYIDQQMVDVAMFYILLDEIQMVSETHISFLQNRTFGFSVIR